MTCVEAYSEMFETKYVKDVYNKISLHFDKTRYKTWPKIQEFTDSFTPQSLIADVGCGNGRNCNLRDDCQYHGYDNCEGFVNICNARSLKCKLSSITNIDCETNLYDYTMCIAVIHHLKTEERRKKSIQELIRITKPNGNIMIYVWAKEQKKFKDKVGNDQMVPWNLKKKYKTEENDIFYRYYHLFDKGELEKLVELSSNNVEIIENGYQKDNYYVILRKIV